MFAYLCRKCRFCSSEFILEQMEDPGSGQGGSPSNSCVSNVCPACRSLFLPESYFVLQSAEPLMQCLETAVRAHA
jgi:hypothetical protein